jgi:hypothetical protein
MNDQLEPCPFCGGDATWSDKTPFRGRSDIPYQIGCSNNGCKVHPYTFICPSEYAAIETWNKCVDAVRAQLVEALKIAAMTAHAHNTSYCHGTFAECTNYGCKISRAALAAAGETV